ncbi:hypothetical protein R3P38DRAFT_3532184 [Favolaschia claudopus]|uniref:Suppressor of forked domain-containing protein n=1 Tax=Favolaschia claudopus TaxID=2862362 RepID=A0AAW0BD79_9AGAR
MVCRPFGTSSVPTIFFRTVIIVSNRCCYKNSFALASFLLVSESPPHAVNFGPSSSVLSLLFMESGTGFPITVARDRQPVVKLSRRHTKTALMEYHCSSEDGHLVASRIFELGMNKFGTDASYILSHPSFLLTVNDWNSCVSGLAGVAGIYLFNPLETSNYPLSSSRLAHSRRVGQPTQPEWVTHSIRVEELREPTRVVPKHARASRVNIEDHYIHIHKVGVEPLKIPGSSQTKYPMNALDLKQLSRLTPAQSRLKRLKEFVFTEFRFVWRFLSSIDSCWICVEREPMDDIDGNDYILFPPLQDSSRSDWQFRNPSNFNYAPCIQPNVIYPAVPTFIRSRACGVERLLEVDGGEVGVDETAARDGGQRRRVESRGAGRQWNGREGVRRRAAAPWERIGWCLRRCCYEDGERALEWRRGGSAGAGVVGLGGHVRVKFGEEGERGWVGGLRGGDGGVRLGSALASEAVEGVKGVVVDVGSVSGVAWVNWSCGGGRKMEEVSTEGRSKAGGGGGYVWADVIQAGGSANATARWLDREGGQEEERERGFGRKLTRCDDQRLGTVLTWRVAARCGGCCEEKAAARPEVEREAKAEAVEAAGRDGRASASTWWVVRSTRRGSETKQPPIVWFGSSTQIHSSLLHYSEQLSKRPRSVQGIPRHRTRNNIGLVEGGRRDGDDKEGAPIERGEEKPEKLINLSQAY